MTCSHRMSIFILTPALLLLVAFEFESGLLIFCQQYSFFILPVSGLLSPGVLLVREADQHFAVFIEDFRF
jgi:hypothetical protein